MASLLLNKEEEFVLAYLRSNRANASCWGWLTAKALMACVFVYGFVIEERAFIFTGFAAYLALDLYSATAQPRYLRTIRSALDKLTGRIDELETQSRDREQPLRITGDGSQYVGKHLLVGITYVDDNGTATTQVQFHGTIREADERGILLERHDTGERQWLPAELVPAVRGEYRLHTTGEVVLDPDYLARWTMKPPVANANTAADTHSA